PLMNKGLHKGLLDALYAKNQLRLEYDAATTRNASQAFASRSGNCLSLVIMTAALAKELGLSVEYHSAFVEPAWSRAGGMYFLSGYKTLGVIYLRHGDSPQAERVLDYVLEREPGNAQALSNLALALEKQGRVAESGVLHRRLAWVEPYPAFHFFDRGLTAMRLGDFKTARDQFAKEVDRDPITMNSSSGWESPA